MAHDPDPPNVFRHRSSRASENLCRRHNSVTGWLALYRSRCSATLVLAQAPGERRISAGRVHLSRIPRRRRGAGTDARRDAPPRRYGDDRRPALHAEHDTARGPHTRFAGAARALAESLPRAEAAAPADARRVVLSAACQAGGGGRLPRGHHPQTHDGKTGGHHAARLTRRATGMGRPWSSRRRAGWTGLPTGDTASDQRGHAVDE